MVICFLEAEHPSNPFCWEGGPCSSWTPLMLSPPPRLLPTGQAAVSDGARTVLFRNKSFQGGTAATWIHGLIYGRLASP